MPDCCLASKAGVCRRTKESKAPKSDICLLVRETSRRQNWRSPDYAVKCLNSRRERGTPGRAALIFDYCIADAHALTTSRACTDDGSDWALSACLSPHQRRRQKGSLLGGWTRGSGSRRAKQALRAHAPEQYLPPFSAAPENGGVGKAVTGGILRRNAIPAAMDHGHTCRTRFVNYTRR